MHISMNLYFTIEILAHPRYPLTNEWVKIMFSQYRILFTCCEKWNYEMCWKNMDEGWSSGRRLLSACKKTTRNVSCDLILLKTQNCFWNVFCAPFGYIREVWVYFSCCYSIKTFFWHEWLVLVIEKLTSMILNSQTINYLMLWIKLAIAWNLVCHIFRPHCSRLMLPTRLTNLQVHGCK